MGDPAVTPRDLEVDAVRVGDRSIVTVVGDIDIDSCRRLRDELLDLIDAGVTTIVLDLAQMDFVDSTGLDVLVGAHKRLGQRGGELVLRSPRPAAQRVLEITRLDTVFTIDT